MGSSELTLEFVVELHKFYNVDLFLRGYYQLELALRVLNTKLPVRVEISSAGTGKKDPSPNPTHHTTSHSQLPPLPTPSNNPPPQQPPQPHPLPTLTTDSTITTTRPFRILFRNEELELKEIFLFRIHFQQELTSSVTMAKIVEELNKVEYFLDLNLKFNDAIVSTRVCQIHYYLNSSSVHYYRNVFFDYFHLCAVSFSIHGGVIAVHISKGTLLNCSSAKPDLIPPGSHPSTPTTCSTPSSSTSCIPSSSSQLISSTRFLSNAKTTHELIMQILLESNSSLKTKLIEFLQVLGRHDLVEGFKSGFVFCGGNFVNFEAFLKEKKPPEEVEEFLLKAHKQIAYLCAENILLWHRFLDLIVSKDPVRVYLANLHHQLRVKRWSEGFYITSNPLKSAYTSKDYTPIVELLKKSINYTPLPIECTEIDGDGGTIPIVFEDQFISQENNPMETKMECNCGVLKDNHEPSSSSSTMETTKQVQPAELSAKLTLLLNPPVTMATKKKKKIKKTSTLPRRHSQNSEFEKKKLRKFLSTPFLNDFESSEEEIVESSESSESGWESSDDNSSSPSQPIFLPPPPQFQDKINPPEGFADSVAIATVDTLKTMEKSIKLTPKITSPKKKPDPPQNNLTIPYFLIPDELRIFHPKGLHLIICVHGLDGSCHDLRLFKIYLQVSLPGHNLQFLMSQENQDGTTFTDFDNMTEKLVTEILTHLEVNKLNPVRVSFVGHSLGNIIIRSALTKKKLEFLLPKLHTFLSLSGPHLGTLYNTGLVTMGMWLMQKWKKSSSLLQLQLKDAPQIRSTFMYKLSEKSNLHKFKYVLLCGSSQDRYVPVHSAHVINCKASLKDGSAQGEAYREMVMNILNPILTNPGTKLIRYDVHHAINPHTANSLIGRAAHIAVLDSEIFIEKFLSVSGVRYFQ
ncbi:LOW QUALITY PROTEIN: protein FAM135A-like [Folsomia candida]|uniref:LOW QUALITY PROTEIN: protein FAM135A-like n=1 Tax=Folsomia candida TaxID=158441 RepID=UPI001604FFE1|nr:LOW QUALITY PROTEIN: protein FAM135A-like [Folsomia candida]